MLLELTSKSVYGRVVFRHERKGVMIVMSDGSDKVSAVSSEASAAGAVLGRMGKGKPKRLTEDEIKRRTERLLADRAKWLKKARGDGG